MTPVSTWEQRMAWRASLRAQAADVARQQREAADRAALIAADPPLAGENDWVIEDGPHRGHYVHSHPSHLGVVICSCGVLAGTYGYASSGEPEPEPCPVCVARGIPLDGR